MPLVLVRVPTFRRPHLLTRAIACLQAQTHEDWICEVRDDCPDQSARLVVEELADPRIRYIHNKPQKFLIRNLDDCFRCDNPYGADFFFLLEDDNQVRPQFMQRGIEILAQTGLSICQLDQLVDYVDQGRLSEKGLLAHRLESRVYQPVEFRLSLFGGIGISNGAVFWSRNIKRELSFGVDTIPALDEFIRTCMVSEPIYISHEPLAIWRWDEQGTTRNNGLKAGRLKRELDLHASLRHLRRDLWKRTPEGLRREFLAGGVVKTPMKDRFNALRKAGLPIKPLPPLRWKEAAKHMAGTCLGRVHPSVANLV